MEQRRTVHFEIQCENGNGEWAELLTERPKAEEEIPDLCDRVRSLYPRDNIRVVKVTTIVSIEELQQEPVFAHKASGGEQHSQDRVHELLQDCD